MNIQQAVKQAEQRLAETSSSARLDAQVLLAFTLQCNTAHLAAWPEKKLSSEQQNKFQQLVQQREQGLPVAHLTQQREFWSLNFAVNNSTLIPRPETETLVEFILEQFSDKKNLKLLDMGTGSGAIAIALASEKPDSKIFATDISNQALALAKKNSATHKTDNITFIQSDWFENISESNFDIIVSNPPYIATDDPHLQQGDVRHEPHSALTSGKNGMDDIEKICSLAKDYLKINGCLVIEHGYNQKQEVAHCFKKNNFKQIIQKQDLSGQPRLTAGNINT